MQNQLAKQLPREDWTIQTQGQFLQTLVDSKTIPCKSVEEAFTVATYGRELGLTPMTSFSYIQNIKGRLTLSVKGQKALLLRGGVTWKIIWDGIYLYSDGSIEQFPFEKEGLKLIDQVSKVEFTRHINGITMVETGLFSMKEARKADLVKDGSGWVKYPQVGGIA